jgi:phosphoribosylanthranilate isomerase
MIVQIYEIQTPQEAEKCIELGVDHLGSVILSQDEWRLPVLREAVRLTRGTRHKSSMIPLFQDLDTVCRVLDYYQPDYIHFCDALTDGNGELKGLEERVEFQETVNRKFPEIGIIRTIPIPRNEAVPDFPSLQMAAAFEPISDLFLTDTWREDAPVEGFVGITGETVDRKIAQELVHQSTIPVILAGGLSPENVADALRSVRAAGADSCTLTNRVDHRGSPIRFEKDFGKVGDFVKAVREVEAMLREEKDEKCARLTSLKEALLDREEALPAHSVRPHQLLAIEALEDEIEALEKEILDYQMV